ncbi:disulfide bond formation protein B [Vibrio ostreicida]|uniref:Disulfide bond formation protein B n=1 Tax=Vibrio ostreicida TaxID=526588 RepID=A0ABT8BU02_9VIBR|nr:disulfide bond formation protein B [Vibrio ostreicida]MDN3609635.1 disulfide bond formation protein B [Vibrio ostreicida]NPD09534.1 disulfide bond formation protein B [Vibrio ostreicida]
MNKYQVHWLNLLGLLGMSTILLIGFVLQFALHELPCPLCLLQRVGFVMVTFGFLLNVRFGPQQRHYGIILIGALFGGAAALRQVALHVIPGTPAYGSPIMGLHYYTWAFVLFAATIFAVAILLCMWDQRWQSQGYAMGRVGKFACYLALAVVLLNALGTFAECGPYQCPDNPVSYWLFG